MGAGYGQFCPVAVASEIFAERWTPIILRELLAGAEHFNEIHRGIPRISRALLASRLRGLEQVGVISVEPLETGRGRRYRLTEAGRELRDAIEALGRWGQRWTARVDPRRLDPGFLMWNLRRRVALDRLPSRRVVLRFRFTGAAMAGRVRRTYWLVLEPSGADLCVKDPGFEIDLYVEAQLHAMAEVWLGDLTFDQVLRGGELQLSGPRELTRAFPSWWLLSPFAAVPRPPASLPLASNPRPPVTAGPESRRRQRTPGRSP